jgi:hypothetical protein
VGGPSDRTAIADAALRSRKRNPQRHSIALPEAAAEFRPRRYRRRRGSRYRVCLEATVRVEIRAAPENARSRAIPERLGFTQEGTLRQVERVGDRYLDNVVYAMLAEHWKG